MRIFSLAYLTRWFSFATQSYMLAVEKPVFASSISVSTALIFPMVLVLALQPLGLTGIWMNFPGTALLAAVLAFFVLRRFRKTAPATAAGAAGSEAAGAAATDSEATAAQSDNTSGQ